MKKICIVGASGKLGQYMVRHALERGYEVVGVCRERSVGKLDTFKGRITIIHGATSDREVIKKAVAGCDGVLVVLVPWGIHQYSSGTAQAVLDYARPGARLIFSCGWHITLDGQDAYSRTFKAVVKMFGWIARLIRVGELDDQVEACRLRFYCGALGCSVERRQDEIGLVQLRAGRSIIDLIPVDGKLGKVGSAAPGKEARNLDHFCLWVDPFDEPSIRSHLEARGI